MIFLLNHNDGMQNKSRTITFRVGDEVAEGIVGNAGNDRVNCY